MRLQLFYILLIVALPTISIGQSRWTNVYYGNKDANGRFFTEYYDHGYLILGKHGHNAVHYNWLIKTDINGQVLWNKTLGDDYYTITLGHLDANYKGAIYCVGITNFYDEYNDPIILKLDSCGNKQWCRVFYTPDNYDFANHVQATEDGGCLTLLLLSGEEPQLDRICLSRFNKVGDLLWKECYNSQDTSISNAFIQSFIQTQDKGFLLTGHTGYEDPNQPNLFWSKPYYIKTDSLGVFEWEVVVHSDVGGVQGGSAWSTSINPSGTLYYSSISHYYPGSKSPALLKMDLNGNVIDIYDIVTGYFHGGLTYATFINDSTLAAGIGWGNTEDDIKNYAVLIDTSGNIKDSTFLVQDIYTIYMDTVYDNKLVYMYNTYQNGQFDVYLRKLNQELEDDTLYTYPFQYDTLCPYPIASDTIVQDDCGLIVGIEDNEKMERKKDGERMVLYPNPASDYINCRLSVVDCQCSLFVYDMFGRKMEEILIPKGQQLVQLDVSGYGSGIYIAVLKNSRRVMAREKFVVY